MLSPESSRMSPSNLEVFVLGTRGEVVNEAGDRSEVKGNTETVVKQTVCTGARNLRTLTRVSLRPLPQWPALQGCMTVVLMTEYDNTEQVSGQCARDSCALARVRRAYLWRAQRACATPLPQGGAKARSSARGQRDVPVCLTSSPASAFVDVDHVRSSPLGAHCQVGRTLYTPLTMVTFHLTLVSHFSISLSHG